MGINKKCFYCVWTKPYPCKRHMPKIVKIKSDNYEQIQKFKKKYELAVKKGYDPIMIPDAGLSYEIIEAPAMPKNSLFWKAMAATLAFVLAVCFIIQVLV